MEPNYAVIRDPDEPSIDGKWFDLNAYQLNPTPAVGIEVGESVTYTPTPFIEVREDGAVAQVWMRRPQVSQ